MFSRAFKNGMLPQAILFLLFLLFSIPGVTWGTPDLWNPDELVWRAAQALNGELLFDQTEPDFNYPSLPKRVMYAVGEAVFRLGGERADFIVAARIVSALLGALAAVMTYHITRLAGGNARTAFLAGLFYIASGVASANARFAHNDLYLQFFAVLCVYATLRFQKDGKPVWLHLSFLFAGMAASSKYTGASLLLIPLAFFFFSSWQEIRRQPRLALRVLILAPALSYVGYALGTPRAFLAPLDYFPPAVTAALNFARYGFNSAAPIGLLGQWAVFREAVGGFFFWLFLAGFLWGAARGKSQPVLILLFTILLFDLPYLVSINYIPRHFIPFVPFFAALSALFVWDVYCLLPRWRGILALFLAAGLFYGALRLAGIALLFMNDARVSAGAYVASLESKDKIIEYTLYPPHIERKKFEKAYNYPIYFVKYAADVVPSGGRYEYNQGEAGLAQRDADYLVIDSLTYARFNTPSVCATNPVECDFFHELLSGKNTSFRLAAEFSYALPPYLPQISIAAVNPDIKIYRRATP